MSKESTKKKDSDFLSQCVKNGIPVHTDEEPYLHYAPNGKILGKGATGEVSSCVCKKTGKKVAIKKTPENPFSIHEMITWSAIGPHQNVVRLIEIFVWQNTIYAVMELMDLNLTAIIPSPKNQMRMLQPHIILMIIRQLICGLMHMHSKMIPHGDIKSDNVLIDAQGSVKIADFGVSTQHGGLHPNAPNTGTWFWKSPNSTNRETASPIKDDIWALGITIEEILGFNPPFLHQLNGQALIEAIRGLQAPPPLPDLKFYGQDFEIKMHGLLDVCLKIDPAERFTAEELLFVFDSIFETN
jgi:serine/threonine protein kinase